MGYDRVSIEFVARVSRHNSDKDDAHDALWENFVERVETISREPQFEEINLWRV